MWLGWTKPRVAIDGMSPIQNLELTISKQASRRTGLNVSIGHLLMTTAIWICYIMWWFKMGSPKPCVSILTCSNFGRFGGGAFVGNLHLNLYKLPSQQPYLKNGLWNPQEEGICSLSTLVATGQTSQSFLGFWHGAPALALLVPVELPATKSGKVRVLQHRYRTLQEIWDLCNIMHTYYAYYIYIYAI